MARAWAISGDENRPQNMGLLVFKGWVILYTKCKDYSNNFGEGERTSRNWAKDQFLAFFCLGTVMEPVGVSFSMLMCYNECIMRLRVNWKSSIILGLLGSN